jgi:hypothetical protein
MLNEYPFFSSSTFSSICQPKHFMFKVGVSSLHTSALNIFFSYRFLHRDTGSVLARRLLFPLALVVDQAQTCPAVQEMASALED